MSYLGRGTTKPGVKAEYHTIIHTSDSPVALQGENGIVLTPLKVKPDDHENGILDRASRLNYAKLYTVEHNVKVWFVSRLNSAAEIQLRIDYDRIHPQLTIDDRAGRHGGRSSGGGSSNRRNYNRDDSSSKGSYGMGTSGNTGSGYNQYQDDQFSGYNPSQYQSQTPYPNYQQASYQTAPNSSMNVSYSEYGAPQTTSYGSQYVPQSQDPYSSYQHTAYQYGEQQPDYSSTTNTTVPSYASNSSQSENYDTDDTYRTT